MKKIFSFAAVVTVISALFFGCSDIATSSENELSINSQRRQTLAFYAGVGNYKANQNEMEATLASFLTISEDERSVTNVSNYVFTLAATDSVEVAKNTIVRSANLDSYDDVDLYLYNMKNTADGTEGFAITSTDRRIGTVLAFVPNGTIEDARENPFLEIFFDNLEEYIGETVEIWNDLSDEELSESRASASSIITSGNYTFSNWQFHSGNVDYILKTKWGQGSPYNTVVNQRINDGKSYPVGCGPTALAQLLAVLEYPKQYDWIAMKANPYAINVSASAKNMIANLMSELGIGLNVSYSTTGTGCFNSDVEKYLLNNGYSYSGFKGYDLSSVQSSIDNGYPVMAQGYATKKTKKKKIFGITYKKTTSYYNGHYWIIDAYARFSCNAKNKTSDEVTKITENFVHCNLGWDGGCNGYYLNGVFDTAHVPVEYTNGSTYNTGNSSHNFQYKQQILTNLHHN